NNTNNYKEIRLENLHISQGWFDSSVSFGEPGYEERETIENGLNTAGYSGFTAVAMNPNTNPVLDTSSDIAFAIGRSKSHPVQLLPLGALTKESKGQHLAELFDMQNAGAIAFVDYQKSLSNPNLMKVALQYADTFGGLVCSFPIENEIAGSGVMNEEYTSTRIGLKGIPNLAEELQIARDLYILEYTGGKLHIPTISTAGSVELIRKAKKAKLDISCSVAIHNLYFTDTTLENFNSNFKVLPPLRSEVDRSALIDGLKDGTIDMVVSDHNPLDVERKKLEFDYADFGTIGLESAFGALHSLFSLKKSIELLTKGKHRFGFENVPIEVGNKIDATLFNPKLTYEFSMNDIFSKSKNAIFDGIKLKGKAYGIITHNTFLSPN
ncbi:MAG: amidohydrolase family protein, partial [Flavobacteriaceae bacterium]|nr:amidohydrolase family protein [Flavobacteriaceae bacterium]